MSALPSIIRDLEDYRAMRYANIAFLTLLVFDHFLTLESEVRNIISAPLFLTSTYFPDLHDVDNPVECAKISVPDQQISHSNNVIVGLFIHPFNLSFQSHVFGIIALMGLIRISLIYRNLFVDFSPNGLYGTIACVLTVTRMKSMLWFLAALFTCEMGAWIAVSAIVESRTTSQSGGPFLSGCLYSLPDFLWVSRIPPIVFEGIIMALTAHKILLYATVNPTLFVLARDSMVYFVLMFTLLAANLVMFLLGRNFLRFLLLGYVFESLSVAWKLKEDPSPSNVVACIAAARMMINMRGLALQPGTMAEIELQPITFEHTDDIDNHNADQTNENQAQQDDLVSRAATGGHPSQPEAGPSSQQAGPSNQAAGHT
ncbi:hypothetical protein C8J56DRAFT_1059094 [Mycena floridula]|nr:hypothetical protein C8J56DRAFT_1059094 [Mycena floridula]